MLQRSLPLWPEGWPFVALAALAALCFALLGWPWLTVLCLAGAALAGHVFRDPERLGPDDAESAVAPVDGKVLKVERAKEPLSGDERLMLSLSPGILDVHVLRFPVSGKVERLASGKDDLGEDLFPPRRHLVEVIGKGNQRFIVAAHGAPLFRQLTSLLEKGDKLKRGERFGFASGRVDLYLPDGFEARVMPGDRVRGGETELAARGGVASSE